MNIWQADMSNIYQQITEWPERVKTLRPGTVREMHNRATDPNREVRHLLASPNGTCNKRTADAARLLVLPEVPGSKTDY